MHTLVCPRIFMMMIMVMVVTMTMIILSHETASIRLEFIAFFPLLQLIDDIHEQHQQAMKLTGRLTAVAAHQQGLRLTGGLGP